MRTPHFLRACPSVGRLSLLAAIGGLFAASPAAADLILKFANDRPDASTVPAYITFGGGGPFDATATINGVATDLELGQSYLMSSLTGGVDVTQYQHGRVFVSLATGLVGLNASNAYAPNFAAPQDNPNFLTRFDKYEITYLNGSGGANLSSTDFFGIPLKLTTMGGDQPPKTLTWHEHTAAVLENLGALANYSTDTLTNPLGALVTNGKNGVTINTPGGPLTGVVRIIAPSSTNGGVTPFPSFTPYLTYLQTSQVHADIEGANGQIGSGGPWQNYKLDGYISNTVQTINGISVEPGDLVLNGAVTVGAGAPQNLTIVVQKQYLTSFKVYGADLDSVAIVAGTNQNGIVSKALADYFAGLNFGFIGSAEPNPTTNPTWRGKPLGASPSWTWYGNIPNGGPLTAIPLSAAYAAAQPNPNTPYYNQYAAYLNNDIAGSVVTDSYGFPYTDRLASPLADLTANTTLTMTILPDAFGSGSLAVPEPSTWGMVALGFAGLGFVRYRRARKRRAASGAGSRASVR